MEAPNPYELMLVFRSDLLENALEKKLKEFEQYLEENEGSVILKDLWGKRDLAYSIKQHDRGLYVAYNLSLPASFLKELDEHLRIDKDILRHLVIRLKTDYRYEKPQERPNVAPAPAEKEEAKEEKKAEPANLDEKLQNILKDESLV